MRSRVSNLRGVRSESGMLMENSRSSAATKSARAKESSSPDSKRDSPGDGSMGLPANCRRTSRILFWRVMENLVRSFRTSLFVGLEKLHQIGERSEEHTS